VPQTAKQRSAGLKHGWRSGLEEAVADQLRAAGVRFLYERVTIPYTVPESTHRYTPDFILPNGIVVETKGRWLTSDRKKIKLFVKQHPEIDLRIVFSNPRSRISKQSSTTYAKFCETHGIPYAGKLIPLEWTKEPRNSKSLRALRELNLKKERK
jgi:hypothetical protein